MSLQHYADTPANKSLSRKTRYCNKSLVDQVAPADLKNALNSEYSTVGQPIVRKSPEKASGGSCSVRIGTVSAVAATAEIVNGKRKSSPQSNCDKRIRTARPANPEEPDFNSKVGIVVPLIKPVNSKQLGTRKGGNFDVNSVTSTVMDACIGDASEFKTHQKSSSINSSGQVMTTTMPDKNNNVAHTIKGVADEKETSRTRHSNDQNESRSHQAIISSIMEYQPVERKISTKGQKVRKKRVSGCRARKEQELPSTGINSTFDCKTTNQASRSESADITDDSLPLKQISPTVFDDSTQRDAESTESEIVKGWERTQFNNKKEHTKTYNTKKRKEVNAITKDEGRLSKNGNSENVQLFASLFCNSAVNLSSSERPKRRIKSVARYEATPAIYATEAKRQEIAGLCGSGFNCPACLEHLSYDAKQCYSCLACCEYQPGVGGVLLRERNEVTKAPYMYSFDKRSLEDGVEVKSHQVVREANITERQQMKKRSVIQQSFQFGCQQCSNIFTTLSEHVQQMTSKHSTLEFYSSSFKNGITKVCAYQCASCQVAYPSTDLNFLMKSVQSCSIGNTTDITTRLCPFCLADSSGAKFEYKMIDDLIAHLSKHHLVCALVEQEVDVCESSPKLKPSSKRISRSTMIISSVSDRPDPGLKRNWSDLSFENIVRSFEADTGMRIRGENLESVLAKVSHKLQSISQSLQIKFTKEGVLFCNGHVYDDAAYTAELRLFNRGLRESSRKADCERIEKMNYKEKCEELVRVTQYKNRTKKKTPAEVENAKLLSRPIRFEMPPAQLCNEKCNIGETNCDLCNGAYARWIVTDDEIQQAGGDILQALPVPFALPATKGIPSPRYKELEGFDDISKNFDDLNDQPINGNEASKHSRRGVEKHDDILPIFWKLNALKHSLVFIQRYNEGLLLSSTKN